MADSQSRKSTQTNGELREKGYLYWFGYICSIILFLLVFIAFASPYWFKSWARVHSPLANVGLWHICLSGWVKPQDPELRSYVGCWWIHSAFFEDVWNDIMPPWFRAVQALVIFTLLCSMASVFVLSFYLKDQYRIKYFEPRKLKLFILVTILMFGAALLILITALVFAFKAKDPNWMPRPWLSYFSFSYGFYVLSGFFAAFGGMSIFLKSTEVRTKKRRMKRDGTMTHTSHDGSKPPQMHYPRHEQPMHYPQQGPPSSHGSDTKAGESYI